MQKVRKTKKNAEMTTNKCVHGKITKTNLVQRNLENLGKRKKKGN